ncbi:MAG: hypothetical protein ACQEWU_13610 [Bacillota bacterium]
MEALPTWFLVIYFSFIIFNLVTAIISNIRDRWIPFAYKTIILTIAIPFISFIYSVERPVEVNPIAYIFSQMANGKITAILLIMGHLYLLFWFILYMKDSFGKQLVKYYRKIVKKIQDKGFLNREKSS